ncbi:hypothetical protein [Sicyoidochytrium minutum DNA virus]|nr:hypothetical protein [Sicyoidochytrium minutum DNA virus]
MFWYASDIRKLPHLRRKV